MNDPKKLIAELDQEIEDVERLYYEGDHDWTIHESAIRILNSKYNSHRLHPVLRLLAERGLANYMRHKNYYESLSIPSLLSPEPPAPL